MKVEVRVFATYRKLVAEVLQQNTEDEIFIDLPQGSTLQALIEKIGLGKETSLTALVNGLRTETDYLLSEGDRIGLFPPVGGG